MILLVTHHLELIFCIILFFFACAGWNSKASKTWRFLSDKYPNDVELKNKLGVSLLMSMQNEEARKIFKQVTRVLYTGCNGYFDKRCG